MGKFKKFLSSLYPSNATNGYGIYLVACHQDGVISDGGWRIYSNVEGIVVPDISALYDSDTCFLSQ